MKGTGGGGGKGVFEATCLYDIWTHLGLDVDADISTAG